MIKIDLSELQSYTLRGKDGVPFLPLGKPPASIAKSKPALQKIKGIVKKDVTGIWGTLGMMNNTDLHVSGKLEYSENGNLNSKVNKSGELTLNEIDLFYQCRGDDINKSNKKKGVIERFISFKNVDFKNYPEIIRSWSDIPKLRLTLYIKNDEGALLYYQYDKNHPMNPKPGKGAVEYIQPMKTKNNDCSSRDRLTYEIPILPKMSYEPLKNKTGFRIINNKKNNQSMLVKILVGKRQHSNSDTMLKRLHYHLFGHTHQLLTWNRSLHNFEPADKSVMDTAVNKKILFLIHGTFSSTQMAFSGLLKGGATSWISKLDNQNRYDKIIAFDHPTFSEAPEENIKALLERLPLGFHSTTDIISHSRGALVGKYLSQYLPQFNVNKGVMVAGANGVGYFTVGWGVSKFLSIMKYSTPIQNFIAGIAQHSIDWFLKQPGSQAMTPGSDILESILNGNPAAGGKKATYLPIVGDYTSDLVSQSNFFSRLGQNALDLAIKLALGWEHDWVVGSKQQAIYKPGKLHKLHAQYRSNPYPYPARHSDYFKDPYIQSLMGQFLL